MEYSVFGAFLKFFEKKRETFVSLTSEKNYFFLASIFYLRLICSSIDSSVVLVDEFVSIVRISSFNLSVTSEDSTFPVPFALGVGNSSNFGGRLSGAFFLIKNFGGNFDIIIE